MARRWRVRLSLLVAVCLAVPGSAALAQVAAGEITGIVKDQAGAAVPGATVTVTDVNTNLQRIIVSSGEGVYTAPSLAPGDYRVDVELTGFKPVRRAGIRLSTGEKARIDFDLAVGNVSEQVTVTADAPILRAETASLGMVVAHEQVVQLPLNGRSFILLAGLAPGVALPPNSPLPRINGGRPRTNEYLFDGISVLQPEPGQVAFFPVIDAIQEFKIESNSPPAEFGRFNGGVINLTTKAGRERLSRHRVRVLPQRSAQRQQLLPGDQSGEAGLPAESVRRPARRPAGQGPHVLLRRLPGTAPVDRPHRDVHGADAAAAPGGLHRSDRRTRAGDLRSGDHGRLDALAVSRRHDSDRAGWIRSRCRCCSATRCRPRPASPTTSAGPPTRSTTRISGTSRIDHKFSTNRDQLFGRLSYFRDGFLPVTPLLDGSGVTTGTLGPQDTTAWSFASNYQHTFSSNLLNEVRVGDTRRTVARTAAQLASSAGGALNIPGIPSTAKFPNTLPTFLIGGYQQLGSPPNTASDFGTGVTEVADSLTWLKGRHTIKIGLDFRWERLNVIQPPSPTGSFTFNAVGSDLPGVANTGTPLASFLLGQVQLFSIDLQQSQIQERAHFQEYFIQDDWKVSDRLTLNPGLRYTLNFPSNEINGQTAVFNLQTQQLEYPGDESGAAAQEGQLRTAHGRRLPAHRQDDSERGLRHGLDRNGGHHHAVHDADVSVPADGLAAGARHDQPGVRPAERAHRHADRADADGRPRSGRLRGRRHARVRLRAAVERVGAAGADDQHHLRGGVRRIVHHPRRPPGHQPQSALGQPARAGRVA